MSFSSIPVLADDGSAELHAATDEPGLASVTWVAYEGDGDVRASMLVDVRDLRAWCEAVLAMLREVEPVPPAEMPAACGKCREMEAWCDPATGRRYAFCDALPGERGSRAVDPDAAPPVWCPLRARAGR